MDAAVLIDAVTATLADSCKDFCQAAIVALRFMKDTIIGLMGDWNTACKLPFFTYVLDEIADLCYQREWYARLGGCTALRFVLESFPRHFVVKNIAVILDALFEVIAGLADEVSNGAMDISSRALEDLLSICFTVRADTERAMPSEENDDANLLRLVVSRCLEHLLDSEPQLRNECYRSLATVSRLSGRTELDLLHMDTDAVVARLSEGVHSFATCSLDRQVAIARFYGFLKNLENKTGDETISSRMTETETFIENLATIVGVDDQLAEAMPSCQRLLASPHDATSLPIKILPLKRACIEALQGYCVALAKLTPQPDEMETDDDSEQPPKARQLNRLTSLFLENAMTSSSPIQDQCVAAIKEILRFASFVPSSVEAEAEKISKALAEKDEPPTKDLLKNLLFLSELHVTDYITSALGSVIAKVSTIIRADPLKPRMDDVAVVASSLLLAVQLKHADFQLLREAVTYFANVLATSYLNPRETWPSALLKYASMMWDQFLPYLLSIECLQSEAEYRLNMLLLKHAEAEPLRRAAMGNEGVLLNLIRNNSDGTSAGRPTSSGKDRELRTLKLIHCLVKNDPKWFCEQTALCNELRNRWNSGAFRREYDIRRSASAEDPQMIPVETIDVVLFKVPKLYVKIFLAYLRQNIDDIDLLFDICYLFCYTYASDFTFVRYFIDEEVIQNTSIRWKHMAFRKVIQLLKSDNSWRASEHLVRFMQHIVAPSFTYAFEKFDTDEVVGSSADPDQANNEESIVWQICTHIIEHEAASNQSQQPTMSESLKILLYQFCILLVQKCANHIHDTNRKSTKMDDKQQGSRLRQFMLFGWPCLQQSFPGDQTEKYTGLLLIANIIEKFAINRKIMLQVFNTLVRTYQQDHKEVIRKALDILIPSIPKRMDDGHLQLHTMIKKVVIEESHNTAQITHCLNIVVRHYKVFYNVRHALAQVILSSLQRLFTGQYSFEMRRLVVDVCEMFIKWEQMRQKEIEATSPAMSAVPHVPGQPSQAASAGAQTAAPGAAQLQPVRSAPGGFDDINRPLEKPVVDQVVTFLFRTSTLTVDTSSGGASAGVEQLSKRGIMLMRLAMRQNIFGQVATIKPHFMERQLSVPTDTANTEQALVQHQLNQAQATIEVLSSVLLYLPEKTVVEVFTPLQRALINCMNSSHQNLQRAAYTVIAKLFEKTTSSARGLEQFELLSQHIQKNIHDAFSGTVGGSQTIIMGITLLKAICNVQPAYLDTSCLQPFLKMLHRMVREYVVPVNTYGSATAVHIEPKEKMLSEVICYCLEMMRPRINAMNGEVRRTIVQALIVPLVDKNAVDKIINVIIGVAQELLSAPLQQVQPAHQPAKFGMELLLRMQQQLDARLHTNAEMMRAFLSAVVIVFEDAQLIKLQGTAEARARLQPAFYWGLSSSDEALRTRYFAVLEGSFPQDIYQRLVCIMSKQNWQPMSQYFWIAHAARLMLCAALGKRGQQRGKTEEEGIAPPTSRLRVTKCATFGTTLERILEKLTSDLCLAHDQSDVLKNVDIEKGSEAMDVDPTSSDTAGSAQAAASGTAVSHVRSDSNTNLSQESIEQKDLTITAVADRQLKLATATTEEQYTKLVDSLTELMHYDCQLAYGVWKKLFTTIWSQLSSAERDELSAISQPFISSGIMLPQRDASMSVVTCFVDSLLSCEPPVHFQPSLLRYIGTSQKCWHISVLALERQAKSIRLTNDASLLDRDNPPYEKLAVLECLAELYTELNESDQYEMCWKRRVYFEKTAKCLTLYNQGEYRQCRKALEELMSSTYERLSQPSPLDQLAHFAPPIHAEMRHWEQQWANSLKELNDWSALMDFANAEEVSDPSLLMDAAWHSDNWPLVAQSVVQVDACANPTTHFKSTMIKIMSNLANGYQYETKEGVDKLFQDISRHLISEWRKLPRIVSHSHLRLLIATHVVHEVSEANSVAAEIHRGQTPQGLVMSQKLITEVKLVSKTWRNRAMTVIDPMSTWSDLENWRIQHYQTTMRAMDTSAQMNPHTQQMFPMHSIAQTQFQLARNMRRCGQYEMAIEELNKLHKMTSVHSMDASMKVYEHVKCLLKIADDLKESPPKEDAITPQAIYNEATDIIDSTDMQFLTKDHCSRLLTIKAQLMSKMNVTEEANKAFSAAARLQESNVAGSSQGAQVWKYWAEHLERLFLQNRSEAGALEYGTNAIACLMECAKTTNEEKSRAYLAKLFWLLKTVSAYGGQKATGAVDEVLLKYHVNVPASSWVFWLNEIVADIRQRDGLGMVTILRSVAEVHPQQALVALRLTLHPKVVTERIQKAQEQLPLISNWLAIAAQPESDQTDGEQRPPVEGSNADEAMDTTAASEWLRKPENNPAEEMAYTADSADWKAKLCSVVFLVSIVQPTDVACLNTMLNELDELSQSWVETKMCQLRCIVDDCHKHLYAHINELSRAKVPDVIRKATQHWLEQASSTRLTESGEVLWREITSELNDAMDEALVKFAFILRKFMRKLRAQLGDRVRLLKLRNASPYLANFDSKLAEIDVFSGTVCPKIAQYSAYISRFLPVYRLIVRHNTVCRVLLIRSMNGKVYSYILDKVRFDLAKSQASQIFTLLNTHLAKYRETARRFLCFPQPHVLHTGRNSRLMECCPIAGASSQMQNLNADRSYANFRPFIDIFRQELDREAPGRDPYDIIDSFYERITVAESATDGQSNLKAILSEAFREVIAGNGHVGDNTHSPPTTFRSEPFAEAHAVVIAEQEPMAVDEGAARVVLPPVTPVPTSLLSRWFHDRYPDPTTFWHIRKKMAAHFALLGISEYVFSMTAMDLDGLTVDLSTGQLFYTDFSFDIIRKFSETNGEDDKPQLELECIRPVPFRLSSNVAAFLGVSIEGHLCSAAIAAARCFHSRPVDTIIRPLLWDAFWKANGEHHSNGDQQFVDAVFRGLECVSKRVKDMSKLEDGASPVTKLVSSALSPENLCRMNPSWHPWF